MELNPTEVFAPTANDTNTQETPAVEANPAESVTVETPSGGEGGAVEQSSIDAELADRARWLGLDPADFGNNRDRLEYAVAKYDRQLIDFGRMMPPVQGQGPQTAAPAPAQTAQTPAFDLDKVLPELSGEFDPAIVGWAKQARETVKALHDTFAQQLAAQREQYQQELSPLKQEVEQRKVELIRDQVDSFFNGLGKDWEGVYGKGDYDTLAVRNPRALQARNEMYVMATTLAQGYKNLGQRVPPMKELLKRAVAAQHSDQQSTFARQQVLADAKASKQAAAAQVAQKRTVPLTGRAAAIAAVEAAVAQLNGRG